MPGCVALCGSRSFSGEYVPLVRRVVAELFRAHRSLAVGCCRGADAAALLAALPLARQHGPAHSPVLEVFAAFGPSAEGAWSQSAVPSVCAASALAVSPGHGQSAPVCVRWLSGGPASVPLRRRLAARSAVMVRFVASQGPGSGLVVFLGPGHSPGSWLTIRLALRARLPVVVFPCGCDVSSFPPGISWVPAGSGLWASGLRAVAGASGS
jgi:hypothetical protein